MSNPFDAPRKSRRISRRVRRNRTIALSGGGIVAIIMLGILIGNLSTSGSAPVAVSTPSDGATAAAEAVVATRTPIPIPPASGSDAPAVPPAAAPARFDKRAHSLDDPTSPWVVVNKRRALSPVDYTPSDLVVVDVAHTWEPRLRTDATRAVVEMFAAAKAEAGLSLASNSAYRAYSTQVEVYAEDVAANGGAYADTSTARPGHSEHQTGWTMDIGAADGNCSLNTCFADTAEGQWLRDTAWRFGFLLRYPPTRLT